MLEIIYLKYYRPENNRGYSYFLLLIDSLSKCGCTVLSINQKAQLTKDSFGNKFSTSERNPKLFESDNGKKFVYKTFTDLVNKKHIERNSRDTSLGAVLAELFHRTLGDFSKKGCFSERKWSVD